MEYSEHVALNLPSDALDRTRQSKSCKRKWNELTKCQKNTVYLILGVSCLTIFYLSNANSENVVITAEQSGLHQNIDKVLQKPAEISKTEPFLPKHLGKNHNDGDIVPASTSNNIAIIEYSPQSTRQQEVVRAFQHAWTGYRKYAWGYDHLKPISKTHHNWFGVGLTIVDSIDTIYLMNLKREYKEAREWIRHNLNFNIDKDVNLFEITIRVLGGLLSIYHLTMDNMYLDKAIDLADRLLPCFETTSGVPYSDVNLFTKKAKAPTWSPDSSTSEVTTIQLEFRDLSRVTGDPKYEDAVAKVSSHIHTLEKKDGLVPIFINANTGQFRLYSTITLGARGDSYYEYLLKQWLQTGKTIDFLRDDFVESVNGVRTHLVKKTSPNQYTFIGELLTGGKEFKPKMDHLTCYFPGTLALGVHNGLPDDHMTLAEELMTTCYQTYAKQPTFLAPEITYFNLLGENTNDMYVKTNDAHNLLRPEFIESLWYFYQLTGNTTYQDWGWQIFQGFQNYTRVVNGYTSIANVKNAANVRPKDMMESFFLSETLKYLFLLFSDNRKLVDLDKFVINSEAHLLPIRDS